MQKTVEDVCRQYKVHRTRHACSLAIKHWKNTWWRLNLEFLSRVCCVLLVQKSEE